jgi:hypothetical protein
MRKGWFSEEQIINVLKEHQAGIPVVELCRQHGISDATFYTWRSKYGTELTSHAILRWQQECGVGWHYIAPESRLRTPLSKASTAASGTSASTNTSSGACQWRAGSSKHGAAITMPADLVPASGA